MAGLKPKPDLALGLIKSEKEAYWLIGRLRASKIKNFLMKYQESWHVCVGKNSHSRAL